jgi:hypothetical protein
MATAQTYKFQAAERMKKGGLISSVTVINLYFMPVFISTGALEESYMNNVLVLPGNCFKI